ncbi:MAG TPA: hypothetical protein VGH80_13525 [Xanthomonadaceae bacterium]|jgi:hypothetical protein
MTPNASKSTASTAAIVQAEFIEPTRAGRIKLAVIVVAGFAFAWIADKWAYPAYWRYIDHLPKCDSLPWLRGTLLALSLLPLAIAAIWAVPAALKMLKYGQWPVPGALVVVRTPIKRGRVVRWRAYGMLAWSVLVVGLPFFCLHIIQQTPLKMTVEQCRTNEAHAGKTLSVSHARDR